MVEESVDAILKLPLEERVLIATDILESIAADQESGTLTDEECQLIDARLSEYYKHPDAGAPWSEVMERIQRRARQ